MFGAIKDNWRKSEASVIVQNLLEHQRDNMMFSGDPAKTANKLVGDAWDEDVSLMSGKDGPRPHKVSIAAYSLFRGAAGESSDRTNRNSYLFAAGQLLIEISNNSRLYPLTYVDENLLEQVALSCQKLSAGTSGSPLEVELDQLFNDGTELE